MAGQRFIAGQPRDYADGSRGWAPGGPFDCLGPWAKVERCLVDGTADRRTCYATGYADTFYSIPARCQYKGRTVRGYFTMRDDCPVFVPYTDQSRRA